jgi:predicted nucleic acid-binding protein
MYLLDTNVVSERRKVRSGKANAGVADWAERTDAAVLYLSAISIQELEIGALQLEGRDRSQGAVIRAWLNEHVLPAFSGRVLAIDTAVALRSARLHVPNRCLERDALIAATALVHGMTIVTRNVSDFEPTGVAILDPWT